MTHRCDRLLWDIQMPDKSGSVAICDRLDCALLITNYTLKKFCASSINSVKSNALHRLVLCLRNIKIWTGEQ